MANLLNVWENSPLGSKTQYSTTSYGYNDPSMINFWADGYDILASDKSASRVLPQLIDDYFYFSKPTGNND